MNLAGITEMDNNLLEIGYWALNLHIMSGDSLTLNDIGVYLS